MKTIDYSYEVKANIEVTGRDLFVLRRCSESHYDSRCRGAFADASVPRVGENFGNGWVNELRWKTEVEAALGDKELENPPLEDCFDTSLEITVDFRQVDTVCKILEGARFMRDDICEEAITLFHEMRHLAEAMSKEHRRINGTQEADRSRRTTLKITTP